MNLLQEIEFDSVSPEEYLDRIPNLDNRVLLDDHRITHRSIGLLDTLDSDTIGETEWSREDFFRIHDAIVAELEDRMDDFDHNTPIREAALDDIRSRHARAPDVVTLVPNFASVAGGTMDDHQEGDVDLVVRADSLGESDKLALARSLGLEPDQARFIPNPAGPHGDHMPLFHLALVKAEPEEVEIPNSPPRGSKTDMPQKREAVTRVWQEWAEERIEDMRPLALMPRLEGKRVQASSDSPELPEPAKEALSGTNIVLDAFVNSSGVVYATDLLQHNGESLDDLPWRERQNRLRRILPDTPHVRRINPIQVADKPGFFKAVDESAEHDHAIGIDVIEVESRRDDADAHHLIEL